MTWLHIIGVAVTFLMGAGTTLLMYRSGHTEGFRQGRNFAEQYMDAWWIVHLKKHGYHDIAHQLGEQARRATKLQHERDHAAP
jgi:hypothetical protein